MKKEQVFRCEGAARGLVCVRRLVYSSSDVRYEVIRNRKRVSPHAVYQTMKWAVACAVDIAKLDIQKKYGEGIV